jgi:hypothetical protein
MWDVAAIAQNDAVLFGSTHGPFHHVVLNMIGSGLVSGTFELSYWTGAAWTVLTLGTDYTILGAEDLEGLLEAEGEVVINLFPSDTAYDWDGTKTINGVTAYWLRLRNTSPAAACATYPVVGGYPVYAPRTNEIRIPASSLHGDASPKTLMRLISPYGGDENEGPANISRIVWGLKSKGLDGFVSCLNAGNQDNQDGWAVTYGDDTSAGANGRSPGGYMATCTFATDESLDTRVTYTGTDRLQYWLGDYKVYILAEQSGGSSKDVSLMLRTYIGGSNAYDPHLDTEIIEMEGVDEGIEAVDMGELNISFTPVHSSEIHEQVNLIFEIHAGRDSGSAAQLKIREIRLIPIDEASGAIDDGKADVSGGSMALRGNEAIDHDGGIIQKRTNKVVIDDNRFRSVMAWDSGGAFVSIRNLNVEQRIYFLLLHYPTTWGQTPLVATLGCHVAAEIQLHHRYEHLRGND